MIPVHQLTRALEKERHRLQIEELDTAFMKGMVQGINLAIAIVGDIWQKTKNQRVPNPYGLRKKTA